MKDFYGRTILIGHRVLYSGLRAPLYQAEVIRMSDKIVYLSTGERRRPDEVVVEVPCLTHVEEK